MKSDTPQRGYLDEDVIPGADRRRASLRYLWGFVGPDKAGVISAIGLLVVSAALGLGAALALGHLVQQGLLPRSREMSIRLGIGVVALELLSLGAAYVGRRILAQAASRSIMRIRTALFHHINALPLSYYDRQPLGRTVTRISHDVESLETFFSASLGRIALASISITTSLVAMVMTAPRLGLILFAAALPAMLVTLATRLPAGELNRRMVRSNSAINARLAEYLSGISVIRAFGLEGWSATEFRRSVESYLGICITTNRFYSWVRPITELLTQAPIVVLIWIGGAQILGGTMAVGVFVTLARYCQRFSGPIAELSREIILVQEAQVTCERVSAFLNAPTEVSELGPDGERSASGVRGAIEFRGVSMAYPSGEVILSDLTFSVPAGSRVGLAGQTGSGKTTTVSLLARLYEFQAGEITLDGNSIREYTRASLRSTIGFVSQDVVIIAGTIAANLANGRPVPRDEIERAAERTGLSAVLARGGRTLDYVVLDRGTNLSAGERQLVSLTRVLLAAPAILVLDEATANIDPALEATIHTAVDAVMVGRTCLIIAHRLSTLENCDRVLVFKEGRIVAQGSPSTVLGGPIDLPADNVTATSTTPTSPPPETSPLDAGGESSVDPD